MTENTRNTMVETDSRVRADSIAKVTGISRYAADYSDRTPRSAVMVTATVPRGEISRIETRAAESAPGVMAVFTHHNSPKLREPTGAPYGGRLPLQDNAIHYEGEPIAVVIAEQLEQAQDAASLVNVDYTAKPPTVLLDGAADASYAPTPPARWGGADTAVGDTAAGLEYSTTSLVGNYTTAARHHSPLEPSSTLAEWHDGQLTVYDATQGVFNVQDVLSSTLNLPAERVRVISEYVGGGFGCKGYVWPHQIIAAMAALELGEPIRLTLTRAQSFTSHGYQPPTRQRVELGATGNGELTALRHESLSSTATYGEYAEMATNGSRVTYACPAIETLTRVAPVDTILPTPMRSPHEGTGMFALESAMDELAYELEMDPLELRLRNYADFDPTSGKAFSSKRLHACYWEGARRIRWNRRSFTPGSMSSGDERVGLGMATAVMSTFRFPASARVRIHADGSVVVEAGCQEIGTGVYTVMPQIAADVLGCPADQVTLRLGDTTLPRTGMTAGSSTTLSVGSAVRAASEALATKLGTLADEAPEQGNPITVDGTRLSLGDGPVRTLTLTELFDRHGVDNVTAEAHWTPRENEYSMHSYGAVFAEVAVDEWLCVPRVRRLVGVYSAGRIINPRTARSQMTGGMVWGIGQALLERSVLDPNLGRFVSKNFTGYLLPVNADVPELDVSFVPEYDEHTSDIGARGIGELGAVGVSAAIANAVFHATGVRVRDLPITPKALLTERSS